MHPFLISSFIFVCFPLIFHHEKVWCRCSWTDLPPILGFWKTWQSVDYTNSHCITGTMVYFLRLSWWGLCVRCTLSSPIVVSVDLIPTHVSWWETVHSIPVICCSTSSSIDLWATSALFVTWNTRSSRPGHPLRLRGCISSFEPTPIRDGIIEYMLMSSFWDSRFGRINKSELETLEYGYVLSFLCAASKIDYTLTIYSFSSFPLAPFTTISALHALCASEFLYLPILRILWHSLILIGQLVYMEPKSLPPILPWFCHHPQELLCPCHLPQLALDNLSLRLLDHLSSWRSKAEITLILLILPSRK